MFTAVASPGVIRAMPVTLGDLAHRGWICGITDGLHQLLKAVFPEDRAFADRAGMALY
jgi:hypothetical protein